VTVDGVREYSERRDADVAVEIGLGLFALPTMLPLNVLTSEEDESYASLSVELESYTVKLPIDLPRTSLYSDDGTGMTPEIRLE
jgi:hypothetical protein